MESLRKELETVTKNYNELISDSEQHESREASYQREVKFLKKEVENAVLIKNQELQSLRFQLSSLEMKHESLIAVWRQHYE